MATEAPAAPNPTILTEPPPAAPPTPEATLYKETPEPKEPPKPAAPEAPPAPKAEPPAPTPAEKKDAPQPTTKEETKAPTEPEKKPEGQAPPTPAPTEYDLKLPEGSLLSQEELAALTKEAKEAGLTKDEAEGMLQSKEEAVKAYAARQQQALVKASEDWKAACEKDPMLGGEKYAENVELARRGFTAIADLELQQLAQSTGFGNHPAVVRAFAKLGRMMGEDKFVRGVVGPAPTKKSPEQVLYGATTPGQEEPMS